MGLEPDPFINKPMDFRERTDRDTANFFVEKMAKINEVFKNQIAFAQTSYEHYANVHKQNVPNYVLGDEVWLDTRNMQTKRPSKRLSDKFDGPFPCYDPGLGRYLYYALACAIVVTINWSFTDRLIKPFGRRSIS